MKDRGRPEASGASPAPTCPGYPSPADTESPCPLPTPPTPASGAAANKCYFPGLDPPSRPSPIAPRAVAPPRARARPHTTPSRALSPSQPHPPGSGPAPRARGPSRPGPGPDPHSHPARPPAPASRPSAPPRRPSAPKSRPRDAARLSSGKIRCRIPAAELGVRHGCHSRSATRIPALPQPPPPAGLELPQPPLPSPPPPPTSLASPPSAAKRFSNQRAETVAVAGCHVD